MESMAEREVEEVLGSDLVTRRSKPIAHRGPADFGEGESNGETAECDTTTCLVEQDEQITGVPEGNVKVENRRRSLVEEEEEEEGEYVDEKFDEGIFLGQNGGSKIGIPDESSKMERQVDSYLLLLKTNSDDNLENVKSYPETDHNNLEISWDESTNTFNTPTAKASNGDHGVAINGHINGTTKQDESGVIEQAEFIPEFVERVIEKQETHDLFCPNCNSCITKRVILRRRKRKLPEISGSVDYPVKDTPLAGEIVQESSEYQQPPINENGSPPDVFRCLSCFSIFAQIGKSLKLFIKGDRGSETAEDVLELPPSNAPRSEPTATLSGVETEAGTNQVEHQGVVSDQEPSPLKSPPELLQEQESEPPSEFSPEQGNKPLSLPSEEDNRALQTEPLLECDGGNKITDPIKITGLAIAETKATEGSEQGIDVVVHRAEAPFQPGTSVQQTENLDTEKLVSVLVTREPHQTEVSVTIPTDPSPETEPLLQPGTNTDALTAAAPVATRAARVSHFDIIKAIVYGGLIESIASLSVVTSAAGADTKTLNILALGAANMFGGIFFLAHNLRVLKHETSDERYEEALGRPGHFTLHSVVAVISYLLFGLIPPVVYGFSFREGDNRDYKLIAVGLASLFCVAMLSLGKAYARTPPKSYWKTLFYYLGLWVMVCGVSYVAGHLIDLLLKKLALFESSASVGEVGFLKAQWASY